MLLISANPTKAKPKKRKAKPATKPRLKKAASSKGATMAKRRRTAAQKAATKRMIAANRRGKTVHNPRKRKYHAVSRKRRTVHNPVHHVRRRRVHRNPSFAGAKSVLKELLSIEGAMMIGAAMAAPMAADYLQAKIMPTATGWTRIAVKAAIIAAGAYALQRFLKKPKVALAFGVTGAAVLASDSINLYQTATVTGTTAALADAMSSNPALAHAVASGYTPGVLSDSYSMGLADPYSEAFNPAFG